jgi:hypothetical protein
VTFSQFWILDFGLEGAFAILEPRGVSVDGRVDRRALEIIAEPLAVSSQASARYWVKTIELKRQFEASVGCVILAQPS